MNGQSFSVNIIKELKKFRKVLPFLREIPNDVYFQLDPGSFYFPEGEIARMRVKLEEKIGHYVMTYNRDKFDLDSSLESHLCAHLDMPDLHENPSLLELLNNYESKVIPLSISFVIYRNPVTLIDPGKSWLAPIYRKRKKD